MKRYEVRYLTGSSMGYANDVVYANGLEIHADEGVFEFYRLHNGERRTHMIFPTRNVLYLRQVLDDTD